MYYYIIEPSKGKINSRYQEKIKDVLGNLGIAGETVIPTAGRTIEELAHLGVVKGYSTIVAVGSEMLVNKIITILATEKVAQDTVLGIVPDDFNSIIAKRIGATDLNSACNALKFRKLETVDLCLIEPNKYFLTQATIESFWNKEIFFSMEKIKGRALIKKVIITPGLEILLRDGALSGGPSKKFIKWLFGKKESDIYSSYFATKRIRFESDKENIPIKVSGEIVAKTPSTFVNRPKSLKIIVARDRISSEEKK